MRESIGGALLLKIVLIFLVVYISFMAIVIAYGSVFQTKNKIINIIEQSEGMVNKSAVELAAKSTGYHGDVDTCYVKVDERGYYYKLKIFVTFQIPLVKNVVKVPVAGETRLIESGNVVPQVGWEC